VLGLSASNSAPSTVYQPPYLSKTRINAAFFSLRSDSDLYKTHSGNFISQSENFLSGWGFAAPSGYAYPQLELLADRPSPIGTTGGVHRFTSSGNVAGNFISQQPYSGALGKVMTFSVHAKAETGSTLQMYFGGGGNNFGGNFNLTTGVAQTVAGAAGFGASGGTLSTSMQRLNDGWYRCVVSGRVPDTAPHTLPQPLFRPNPEGVPNGKSILVWGAQYEQGSVASTYKRTTGTYPVYGDQSVLIDNYPREAGFGRESAQNLIGSSTVFDTGWNKILVGVTQGGYTAPDGTTTASKLWELGNAVGSGGFYRKGLYRTNENRGLSAAGTGPYTFSFFAKAGPDPGDRNYVQLVDSGYGVFGLTVIDLLTGEVSQSGVGYAYPDYQQTKPIVLPAGDGWWRIVVTYRNTLDPLNDGAVTFGMAPSVGPTADDVYGAGKFIPGVSYAGILVWGAQQEYGDVWGQYTPTSGATVSGNNRRELRAKGFTYQSQLSNINDARELTAWGTIVIPPQFSGAYDGKQYLPSKVSNPYAATALPNVDGKGFSTSGLEGTITRVNSGLPGATLTAISTSWVKMEKTVDTNNARIMVGEYALPAGDYTMLYTVYSQDSNYTEMYFGTDAATTDVEELPGSVRYLPADRGTAKQCRFNFRVRKSGLGGTGTIFRFSPTNIPTGTIGYVTGIQLYETRSLVKPPSPYLENSFGVSLVSAATTSPIDVGPLPFSLGESVYTVVFEPRMDTNGYAVLMCPELETNRLLEPVNSGYSGAIPPSDEFLVPVVLGSEASNRNAIGQPSERLTEARSKTPIGFAITGLRQMAKLVPTASFVGATTEAIKATPSAAQYYSMTTYRPDFSGNLVLSWESQVTSGGYAFKVLRNRSGTTTDVSNFYYTSYLDGTLISSATPNANAFMSMREHIKDVAVGDSYTIQMAATAANSTTATAAATASLQLRNLSAHKTDNRFMPQPWHSYGQKQKIHFMVFGGRSRYGTG
jgi:hypothetical protein